MDLRNGEVAVDYDGNRSTKGPSGRKARQSTSAYLFVGGSADVYRVTISTKGAHFCTDGAGQPCKGNTFGKARKYGSVHERGATAEGRANPDLWCKHVAAALRNPEKIAEAQEITAQAFGLKPKPEATPEAPDRRAAIEATRKLRGSARERLTELEAERRALLEAVAAEEAAELRDALAPLVERFGYDRVKEAAKAAIN